MALKVCVIVYADGSHKHITESKRNTLLEYKEIVPISGNRYRSTLPAKSVHLTATSNTLKMLAVAITASEPEPERYPGPTVIVKSPSGNYRENHGIESAAHIVARLSEAAA